MLKDGAKYDVAIVGAGPAGSTAASRAALGGARALLLEKRPTIGFPLRCAEGITKRMLESCGVEPCADSLACRIDGAKLISPSGRTILVSPPKGEGPCGYMLNRERFDMELALNAADAGAEVMSSSPVLGLSRNGDSWRLKVRSGGRTVQVDSKYVIAADGFESQVGRWGGLSDALPLKDSMSCAEYTLEGISGEPGWFEFYVDNERTPGGYAWVFWKGETTANVGLGIRGDKLVGEAMTLRTLERFIDAHPGLSRGRRVRAISGGVPLAAPLDSTARDGIFLVGDAGRVCDALHGGGISNAIITGGIAGESVARAIGADSSYDACADYERLWRERLEDDLLLANRMKNLLATTGNERIDVVFDYMNDIRFEILELRSMMEKVIAKHPQFGLMMR